VSYARSLIKYYINIHGAKKIALDKWDWNLAKIRSKKGSGLINKEGAIKQLKSDLSKGRLVLVTVNDGLESDESDFDLSPEKSKAGHWLVIYHFDGEDVFYADPWYGELRSINKSIFTNEWRHNFNSVVLNPNDLD
jgi:uncharacterized protein YvpB